MIGALLLILLLLVCQNPAARAQDKSGTGDGERKVLHGSVQDYGIFSNDQQKELGLAITKISDRSFIYLIKPGKAKTARLEEGDEIVKAKIHKGELTIFINRKGKRLQAHIDLAGDAELNAELAATLEAAARKAKTTPRSNQP